jgi:hypothetical protein
MKDGLAQRGVMQIGFTKIGVAQVGSPQIGSVEVSPSEYRFCELCTIEIGCTKIGVPEICLTQISSGQICGIQIRFREVGALKDGSLQERPSEVGSLQDGSTEVSSLQDCSTEVGCTKISPSQICFAEKGQHLWVILPPLVPCENPFIQKVKVMWIGYDLHFFLPLPMPDGLFCHTCFSFPSSLYCQKMLLRYLSPRGDVPTTIL